MLEAEIPILSFVHNTKLESKSFLVKHLKWPNKPCEVPEPSSLTRDKTLSNKAPVVVITCDNAESVTVPRDRGSK